MLAWEIKSEAGDKFRIQGAYQQIDNFKNLPGGPPGNIKERPHLPSGHLELSIVW